MSQTGRAPSTLILMPLKRRSFPLWLLRDFPALLGLLASFWTLVTFAMTRSVAPTRGGKAFRDHFTLLLAPAEARLDYALWRQAYRRIGWHPRGVTLQILPPNTAWSDTRSRLLSYAHAFRNMSQIVDAYVAHLRERFGIAERDLVAHGSTDARQSRAAMSWYVSLRLRSSLSSTRRARPSKASRSDARAAPRGYAHARGPPLYSNSGKSEAIPPQRTASEAAPTRARRCLAGSLSFAHSLCEQIRQRPCPSPASAR